MCPRTGHPTGDENGVSEGRHPAGVLWAPGRSLSVPPPVRVPMPRCAVSLRPSFHHLLQMENCTRKKRSTAGAPSWNSQPGVEGRTLKTDGASLFQGTFSRRRDDFSPLRAGPTLDQHLVLRTLLESWPFCHPFSYSVLGPQRVQGMTIRADTRQTHHQGSPAAAWSLRLPSTS